MDDLVSVHEITGADKLNQKEASLRFGEAVSAPKHIQGAAWAKLDSLVAGFVADDAWG